MKKTLVALAVTAFAASSAQAVEVYNNEGTSVIVDGSLRLVLGVDKKKENNVTTKRAHTNLSNDGSRFGFRVKHQINDDLYALGRLELRFDKNVTTADKFGDLYAKRAYVGLGSKQYGELTFGRQLTIGDDISLAGYDYTYGVAHTYLTTSGNSVVRYDYKGVENLHVGVNYNFADDRDSNGEVTTNKVKSGYGVGALYTFVLGDNESIQTNAGYTRDNYATGTNTSHHKDAWAVSGRYNINDLQLAATYSGMFDKDGSTKIKGNGFTLGAKYFVIPGKSSVYGNYTFIRENTKNAGVTTGKETINAFMLGADYQLHKQVLTYVEGKVSRVKDNLANTKTKEQYIGVGMRVFW